MPSHHLIQIARWLLMVLLVSGALTAQAQTSRGQIKQQNLLAITVQMRTSLDVKQYSDVIALGETWLTAHGGSAVMASEEGALLLLFTADAYGSLNQHSRGLPLKQRALTIGENFFGLEHPATAIIQDSLADTYSDLGQHDMALMLKQRALAIREKSLGPEHPDTALSLNNLAATYSALAQHDKALPLQLRALAIKEKELGQEHKDLVFYLGILAFTFRDLAMHEKALPLFQRQLTIRENTLGSEHLDTATSLNLLASTYDQLAQYAKALPLLERVAFTVEKILGPEHPRTITSLNNLAATYVELAQYDKALPLQLRVVGVREKILGSSHRDTVLSMRNLASTYNGLALHEQALQLNLRTLAISEKAFGPENEDTALSLNNLATTYSHMGQSGEALTLHRRALAIHEKVLGPEHTLTATSLNNLANTYSDLAQHEEAILLHQRALTIREKVLGPEHPAIALSINNIAHVYRDLGQYEKAFLLQIQSLAIREKVFGAEHPLIASDLGNLAFDQKKMGHPEKALQLNQRALSITEKLLGAEHPDTARNLDNLAETYRDLALYEKALLLQQRALAIYEKILGSEHPSTAISLNNIAGTYSALELDDQALPLLQRALTIVANVKGQEHPSTALALSNLALAYSDLGQHVEALTYQQRALAIYEKALGPDHPSTANGLSNLAHIYTVLAIQGKAFPLVIRTLMIREKTLGAEHPDTALAWSNMAVITEATGSPAFAITYLKRAVNIYQIQRERISTIGSNELKSYTGSIEGHYQALVRLLTDQGRLAEAQQVLDMLKEEEYFDFIRRSAPADPRRTRAGYTPTEQVWMTRYQTIANQLAALGAEERALDKAAKLGLTPAQQARQKALQADLAVANKAFTGFLGEMQRDFAAQGPARAADAEELSQQTQREMQALIRQLGPDVALLRYFVTKDKVSMILTTPGVVLSYSSAVDAKALNRQIVEYNTLLRDPKSNPMPAAQALYKLLLAPVASALEQAGIKTVMLSPDGNLRHIPFAALHDGTQFAAQRWRLPLYTAVTKDKLRDAVTPQWQAAGLGVTRALGGLPALPAVRGEINSIIQTRAGSNLNKGVVPGEVYLDEAFTAQRLMDVGKRRFELLHVASHFSLSPGTEVNSFLLLGDGQQLTLGDIRTQNYRFDQVDLLTLSACNTGQGGGRDSNGNEIEGFGVMAQQQGAKAVLATLWPVADQSTATLMADMYQRRQTQSLSKIEALRQAQLALMAQAKYAHPFYWAPFILMGNWY